MNRRCLAHFQQQAGVREGRRCHREFGLQPFHVPGRQEGVVQATTKARDSVSCEVAPRNADLHLHAVDEHLVRDFAQVHVAVEFESESVNGFTFQRKRFSTRPNDVPGLKVLNLPDQLERSQIQAAQFLNEHPNFVIFTAKDGSWSRGQHLLRLRAGPVDEDPFHGRRLVGQVGALAFETAHLPRHGHGTRGGGCIESGGPDAVLGEHGVGFAGEQNIDVAVKVRHGRGFSKDQPARDFHRCERCNSGPVAEERPAREVEIDALLGDAQTGRETPTMLGEGAQFLLTCTVNHQNRRFPTVVAQVGRVPAQLHSDVQHKVFLVRVSDAVGAQHGALVDVDVR